MADQRPAASAPAPAALTPSDPAARAQFDFVFRRMARDDYALKERVYRDAGNEIVPQLAQVRVLASRMNERRDLRADPAKVVSAGNLYAMFLIQGILHLVIRRYVAQKNPGAFDGLLTDLESSLSKTSLNNMLSEFAAEYPPLAVYLKTLRPEEYLAFAKTQLSEDMLHLYVVNENPALSGYRELFDDAEFEAKAQYRRLITRARLFFDTQPKPGLGSMNLLDLLLAPSKASPNSLKGQLEFIKDNFGSMIPYEYFLMILTALDVIKEEERARFFGPGPPQVLTFGVYDYPEPERFTQDKDWMPKAVVLAKSVYVWLDQLSKKYQREIKRLDQVPDEELDLYARWGFSGLWLIGLWERSSASQTIKRICGNPEAHSSAYSLYDYVIAGELGGEWAYNNLKDRAWRRGIRLAVDMVPNHTGIYSKWIMEHPDWFIQVLNPPYPNYRFTGINLSSDQRWNIQIEDGYWERKDAAVVFRWEDRANGSVRFIYHGNDGTSTPWNDTAQLDFLKQEVREAVIQTILAVARRSQIIRFDAAMTLAKKHYQRLWFPQPGSGGDIPSRAEHGLTRQAFDAVFPNEFWREVVDRIAAEVPDTLLLAEAFWLMEGYFVRTLGMHRVYNSAFMNMLKMEENQKYRSVIKNTLEFNPQVLKRYVNFQSNPDEGTAEAQFGKGDKYIGVAMLMVTMPGLPMFAHGQIEGLREKYGMEYRRAYWNEAPDMDLVKRHEAEIFPLMKRRYLFSDVADFYLYDFYTKDGYVDENVFAYSNMARGERALVIYNNKFQDAAGWINTSAAYSVDTGGAERELRQVSLAHGLRINTADDAFIIFRDAKSNMEFIRRGKDIGKRGLFVSLGAYQYHVFLDVRDVSDAPDGRYAKLWKELDGRGVPSIDAALREMYLKPVLEPLRDLLGPDAIKDSLALRKAKDPVTDKHYAALAKKAHTAFEAIVSFTNSTSDAKRPLAAAHESLDILLKFGKKGLIAAKAPGAYLGLHLGDIERHDMPVWRVLYSYVVLQELGRLRQAGSEAPEAGRTFDEWGLDGIVRDTFTDLGADPGTAHNEALLLSLLLGRKHPDAMITGFLDLVSDPKAQGFLSFNRYEGVLWFNKESFESLIWWLYAVSALNVLSDAKTTKKEKEAKVDAIHTRAMKLNEVAQASGYKAEVLLENLRAQVPGGHRDPKVE